MPVKRFIWVLGAVAALGMMLPGMWSGWLEDHIGYRLFFAVVCVATLPSFLATALIRFDDGFGKKAAA